MKTTRGQTTIQYGNMSSKKPWTVRLIPICELLLRMIPKWSITVDHELSWNKHWLMIQIESIAMIITMVDSSHSSNKTI